MNHYFFTTKVLTVYTTSEVIAEPLFWQRFCYPSSVTVHWREKWILLPEPHTALFFFSLFHSLYQLFALPFSLVSMDRVYQHLFIMGTPACKCSDSMEEG